MIDASSSASSAPPPSLLSTLDEIRLGDARKGQRGTVARIEVDAAQCSLPAEELERRLLEMGFVDGARVKVLHEGLFGRDPIAVQLDDMKVALRRREARCVWIRPE